MWLNNFESDVTWTVFQLFLKLHSHISVLWRFCRISVICQFSFSGIELKTEIRKSRNSFVFWSIKFKCIWICFSITISTFWALKLRKTSKRKQTEFNKSRWVRISWKTNIWHMICKVAESFLDWWHWNNFSRVFEAPGAFKFWGF